MQAAQYLSPGTVALVTAPDPEPLKDGLLLRPIVAAICGSDLHFLHDCDAAQYPFKPGFSGHECVAVVEEAAAGAGLSPGQRVLALAPEYDAFAAMLPAPADSVLPVPDNLSSEQALMAQQLGTVIYCCRKLTNVLDAHVAVVGQGPAGLLFTMMLHHMGAASVTGIDIVDHRLHLAASLGATCTVNARTADPVEQLRAHTKGHMADVVVEAVGKPETINLCADLVRHGGDVAIFGVPKTEQVPLRLEDFMRKNVRILTSIFAQREPGLRSFRHALTLIASGRIDPGPLITHRLPFARVADGFELAHSRRDGAVKVLLTF